MKRTYKKIYSLMLAVVVMTGVASCGDEFLDQRPSDGVYRRNCHQGVVLTWSQLVQVCMQL